MTSISLREQKHLIPHCYQRRQNHSHDSFLCLFLCLICFSFFQHQNIFLHICSDLFCVFPSLLFSMHACVRHFVSFMGCSPVRSSGVAPPPPLAPPYLLIWRAAGYWGTTQSSRGSTFTTRAQSRR